MNNGRTLILVRSKSCVIDTARRLLKLVAKTMPRPDWHEPDEQELDARVRGNKFDNAMGDDYRVYWHDKEKGVKHAEKVVEFRVDGKKALSVNLATLCALATIGAQVLTDAADEEAKKPDPKDVRFSDALSAYREGMYHAGTD